MTENLKIWLEIGSNFITIIAFIVILFTYKALIISKKQLNLETITRCIDYYRNHFLGINIQSTDLYELKSYLDFVNEEMFYIENEYIAEKVAIEWLDGMIDVLPIFKDDIVLNDNYCNKVIYKKELLNPNPRIKRAFTLNREYNFTLVYSQNIDNYEDKKKIREKLIKEVLKNLRKL